MKALLFLSALALSGCSADLLHPSPTQSSRLEEARAAILSSDAVLPFSGERIGPWFRARVDGIYIDDSRPNVSAHYRAADRRVYISSEAATYPLERLSAILVHEARHADVLHTCRDIYDQTLDEWGAWAVQAWWLDTHGYPLDAESLRRDQICQH